MRTLKVQCRRCLLGRVEITYADVLLDGYRTTCGCLHFWSELRAAIRAHALVAGRAG